MASIQDFIEQWKKALWQEVNYLKNQGGSRLKITDGKLLRTNEKGTTYWFMLTTDILLPDDTPVRVEYNNQNYYGKIISVEGFDVVLELNTFIAKDVEEAYLYSEPWGLLEALSTRLDSIAVSKNLQKRVYRLLKGDIPSKHPKDKIKNPINEAFLRSTFNSTTFIWGPPGTGKTYTLARMIAKHYLKGKKVLVMAHSNAAVDVLMLELSKFIKANNKWVSGDIIRYGFSTDAEVKRQKDLLASKIVELNSPQTKEEVRALEKTRLELKKRQQLSAIQREELDYIENQLKNIRKYIKSQEGRYVESASILGVTLSKAAMDSFIYEREFDLVVVDEASMAYIPQVAFAASLGKKVVVCGDFKQLPPIAMDNSRNVEKWLKRDIFEAANIVEAVKRGKEHPNLFMLKEQRRMHPQISSFTNKYIYENKVSDHKTVQKKRQSITNLHPFPEEAATLVDLSKMGAFCLKEAATDSRFNLLSVLVSMQFILSGKANGMESIGFVSPYRAQARLLTACIQEFFPDNNENSGDKKIIAATVHKFQGSERDMIIFDTVDSYPQQRASVLLTNEMSERLINVAITRARGKFINIVDRKYIHSRVPKHKATSALIDHLFNNNEFYTRYELLPLLKVNYHPKLKWFDDKDLPLLLTDLRKSKQVIISAPYPAKIEKSVWLQLKDIENYATITFISPNKEGIPLKKFEHIPNSLVLPFYIIDGEILWTGTPIMDNIHFDSSQEPPFLKCRLVSKRVVKLLQSFLKLQTAQYTKKEVNQKLVSYSPDISLKKYITTWDQCPVCKSIRKVEISSNGKIKLVCNHCGNNGQVTRKLLQKYINHTNLCCRECNQPLEATGRGKNLGVECNLCTEKIDVNSLW